MLKENKRGSIDFLKTAALGFLVLVIVVSIGAKILTSVQDTQTADAADYNITGVGIDSMGTFADFFPVIIIVLVAAAIFMLLAFFRRA